MRITIEGFNEKSRIKKRAGHSDLFCAQAVRGAPSPLPVIGLANNSPTAGGGG